MHGSRSNCRVVGFRLYASVCVCVTSNRDSYPQIFITNRFLSSYLRPLQVKDKCMRRFLMVSFSPRQPFLLVFLYFHPKKKKERIFVVNEDPQDPTLKRFYEVHELGFISSRFFP